MREGVGCGYHNGQVVADFASAATGHQGYQRPVAQLVACQKVQPGQGVAEVGVDFGYRRIAYVYSPVVVVVLIEVRFEWQYAENPADEFANIAHPPFFPCPNLWRYVIVYRYAEFRGLGGDFEIKRRIVDEYQRVGHCHFEGILGLRQVSVTLPRLRNTSLKPIKAMSR